MKPLNSRNPLRTRLTAALAAHEAARGPLPGIATAQRRSSFVEQLVDSVRRVDYIGVAQRLELSTDRRDPLSALFDPVLGAIVCRDAGEREEAAWLVFLSVHCGKHLHEGWSLVRQLYAGDGPGSEWTWRRVSTNPGSFRTWLHNKDAQWQALGTKPKFGNHRKYVSLSGLSPRGTGEVIETYVRAMGPTRSQVQWVEDAAARHGDDRGLAFDELYRSLGAVQQFGRLAKFDFLCMLAKCGLADIDPSHAYLADATGPLRGAKLMFGTSGRTLDRAAIQLGSSLGVGMQVIEDALCNWAKSPNKHVRFRG